MKTLESIRISELVDKMEYAKDTHELLDLYHEAERVMFGVYSVLYKRFERTEGRENGRFWKIHE